MRQFRICPDALAVCNDRLVSVVQIQDDGMVVVRDLVNGGTTTVAADSLRVPPALASVNDVSLIDVASASDAQWNIARQREAIVAPLAQQDDEVGVRVDRAAKQLGVSRRTLFRWLSLYRLAPQTSSLLPKRRGTPKGARRIDPRVESVIAQIIDEVYLTQLRARKEEVVRHVQLRCSRDGLPIPSRKPILARLKVLGARRVAFGRLPRDQAARLTDPVPGSFKVERALEVVQIDHTLADVILVDEEHRLPIGRPWLTLAIDVATRMVAGLYVSLEAPSVTSVALCLTHAVLPKDAWLARHAVQARWPVWGLPSTLHADNGPDLTSAAIHRGCSEHGVRLALRPVATPHYGGHIERLIGTLMGRVHMLPGTTRSNAVDRGSYPSEAQATMTLQEFERWLVLEICEQYHRRVHRGLGRSPLSAWTQALEEGTAPGSLPADPEQFTVSFLPQEQRKLRRDGLHLFNIRYWDPALPLIVGLGQSTAIRYDPRNLSRVYVTTEQGRYHPVPYADLGLPPISLWEQRAAMERLRNQGTEQPGQVAMFNAILAQRRLLAEAAQKTKAKRREAQRSRNALAATTAPKPRGQGVDYSAPVEPYDAEIWD